MEATKRHQNYVSDNPNSRLVLLTDEVYPRIKVTFGGDDAFREPLEIEAEEFIGVKGFKAKGKRITTLKVDRIEELEPTRFPDPEETDDTESGPEATEELPTEDLDPDAGKSQQQVIDEMTGQLSLFPDEE